MEDRHVIPNRVNKDGNLMKFLFPPHAPRGSILDPYNRSFPRISLHNAVLEFVQHRTWMPDSFN